MSNIAEEVSDPARIIPRVIFAGLVIVTTLYVLVNFSYFVVLDKETAASSTAIGVTFARATWGSSAAWLVPIVVFLCVFGAMLGNALCSCRVSLSAARQGHLPTVFSLITVHSAVPLVSVHVRGLLALAYAAVGSVDSLIEGVEFIQSLNGLCAVLSLFVLRFNMKHTVRSYRVPNVIAILALLAYVFAVAVPFTQPIRYWHYVMIAGVLLLGVLYYVVFVIFSCNFPGSDNILRLAQKLWLSVPCVDELERILKGKL